MQFDLDQYSELSSGLQWLDGKRSQGKGHRRSKKERRSSHGFGKAEAASVGEDLMFPGDGEVTGKLQVRGVAMGRASG